MLLFLSEGAVRLPSVHGLHDCAGLPGVAATHFPGAWQRPTVHPHAGSRSAAAALLGLGAGAGKHLLRVVVERRVLVGSQLVSKMLLLLMR